MRHWRVLPDEEHFFYSPIGLRLVDELTGLAPIGAVRAELDLKDGTTWRPTVRRAIVTASDIVAYPGLGRGVDTTQPAQEYRIRLEAPYYVPLYRATTDGIEFDAAPYNDANPPAVLPAGPSDAVLLPAPTYPFATHVPVLRGVVRDAAGDALRDVLVQEGLRERVLTDRRGAFGLPLRWVESGVATTINAINQRTGQTGNISVTLPGALTQSQTITVT